MSWLEPTESFSEFQRAALEAGPAQYGSSPLPPWNLQIWEKTKQTKRAEYSRFEDYYNLEKRLGKQSGDYDVRVIFSPLDLPIFEYREAFASLFRVLEVPNEFTVERTNSVSHSFGSRTSPEDGSVTVWFHFLCKHIKLDRQAPPTAQSPGSSSGSGKISGGLLSQQPTLVVSDGIFRQDVEQGIPLREVRPLPQASYSYVRSGFVLKVAPDRNAALTCFGAPQTVYDALMRLLDNQPWDEVARQPMVLLDAVLEGLWAEVDATVWNMNELFGADEHKILTLANNRNDKRSSSKIDFVSLHNIAKHIIHLHEAIESTTMVVDKSLALAGTGAAGMFSLSHLQRALETTTAHAGGSSSSGEQVSPWATTPHTGSGPRSAYPSPSPDGRDGGGGGGGGGATASAVERSRRTQWDAAVATAEEGAENAADALVRRRLQESLRYRRSLFESTRMRLGSLQRRVDNMLTLSFNLVTQQDSMVMIQDSNSMKIIALITMVFLPTTAVASIVGSQLFAAVKNDDGSWNTEATPMFLVMWYITAPLTILTIVLAYLWRIWTHRHPTKYIVEGKVSRIVRRVTGLGKSR